MGKIREKFREHITYLFRKINIFPRLTLIMLSLSIIPMTLIMFFTYKEYSNEIKFNTKQYISLLIGNMEVQVKERMQAFEQMATSFYSDDVIIELLEENLELAKTDKDFLSKSNYIDNKKLIGENLYYFTAGNKYIQNVEFITEYDQYTMLNLKGEKRGGIIKNLDHFLESKYYLAAKNNKGYPCWFDTSEERNLIYKYENSKNGIGNTLTMTVAVYTRQSREFLGVLMINVDVSFLTHSLTNYAFYGTGNTFLLGEEYIISILNPNVHAPKFPENKEMKAKIFGHDEGEFIESINNKNIFVSFKKVPDIRLYIAHLVNMDTLLRPVNNILKRSLFLVMILLIVSIIIANFTTTSISLPLEQLTKSMARFIDNQFAERSDVLGNDELTLVSEKFNMMAEDTERMVEDIVAANIHRKELQLSKSNAELNALQMQINPHFLYNTLDLIRWEMIDIGRGENEASRMLDSFCRLLRMSIKKDQDQVSLSTELAHAKAYIEVINFRGGNEIQLICNEELDNTFYSIPKLTLQPLIENIIVHGFTRSFENPIINLQGEIIGDILLIKIKDNGRGMEDGDLKKLKESLSKNIAESNSIGLHNVNQRFKLLYGEDYGIEIKSEYAIGTEVTIKIPQNI